MRERERERERERGERERERKIEAALLLFPDNDRQCSKGQPHCTTRYCTIHRIHN